MLLKLLINLKKTFIVLTSILVTTSQLSYSQDNSLPFSIISNNQENGKISPGFRLSAIPFQENFNDPDLFLQTQWQRFQEVGEQNWMITDDNNRSGDPYSARMNGFTSSPQENRTWLISPAIETTALSANEFLVFKFDSRFFFADGTPKLRVFASTDYDRSGDPTDESFTWAEVPVLLPLETGVWQNTGEINLTSLAGQGNLSIAIIYESTSQNNGAAEWMVDNFEVYATANAPQPIISTNNLSLEDYYFGSINPGASSNPRSFTINAYNLLSPITLTADPGIEMSVGENYSSQISLNEEAFSQSGTWEIQTRMTASEDGSVLAEAGSITISTDGVADTTVGYFNHTTIDKESTFDVVTWNIEWFGDPTNATTPSTDLQRERVRQLIQELDADVYAFQEITSIPNWNLLVAELQDYDGVLSPATSGPSSGFGSAQKLAFLFKKSTVDTLSTKVLLNNINANALTGFPVANTNLFWASGRYPFAMDISTTINGVKRDLTLVNIHGRSNGGGESTSVPRYQLRRYDVEVLYDSLQEYYADKSVILIGDYNDDILRTVAPTSEPTVPNNGESSYIKFISDSSNYLGVSMPMSKAGLRSFVTQENVIDHIIINRNLFDDHILGAERIVIPYSTISDFNTTTSDHFPVEARFLLSGESITTAIEDIKSSTIIHPNPTQGIIYLKNFNTIQHIELCSAIGTKVADFQGDLNQIDLSNFQSGIYLVKISSKSGQIMKRIIVE